MKLKLKPVLLAILGVSLFGCNSGTSVGGTPSGVSSPTKAKLKAEIGSIGMLGEPADVDGKSMLLGSGTALDPYKVPISFGTRKISSETTVTANSNSIAKELFTSVNAKGGFGLFSASLGVEYAKKQMDQAGAVTLISSGTITHAVELNPPAMPRSYLNPDALAVLTEDPGSFQQYFGSGYVSTINVGTKFNIIYTLSSGEKEIMDSLKLAAELSYGSIASFSASLKAMNSDQQKNITKNIKIEINGITGTIPDLPECNISDLEKCTTNLINTTVEYINNTNHSYDDLTKQINEKGSPTLASFKSVFNTSGIAGPGDLGLLYAVNFKQYPNINISHDYKKEEKLNYITDKISKSAMLSGDSSLMSVLKNNKVVYDAISANPDIKSLLDSEATFTANNNALINTGLMEAILKNCFSGSVTNCDNFLTNKKLGTAANSPTIQQYFNTLDKFDNNSVFELSGYYSDVTPALANIFWLEIKNASSRSILVPINLNERTAIRCKGPVGNSITELSRVTKLNSYSGLETLGNLQIGSVFKDIKNGVLSTEFYATPEDLILYPTYDKGKITKVERSAPSMQGVKRNGRAYDSSADRPCSENKIWSPSLRKKVDVTKCDDSFGDFNGLQFYKEGTLLNAISKYRDKPITNRGYHVASADICSDVGARDLTPEQPWCTEDNGQCLSLTSKGNLIWDNFDNNDYISYGASFDNNRRVFLSSKKDGLYYDDKEGNDLTKMTTTIPGYGDGVIIDKSGVNFYNTNIEEAKKKQKAIAASSPTSRTYEKSPADTQITDTEKYFYLKVGSYIQMRDYFVQIENGGLVAYEGVPLERGNKIWSFAEGDMMDLVNYNWDGDIISTRNGVRTSRSWTMGSQLLSFQADKNMVIRDKNGNAMCAAFHNRSCFRNPQTDTEKN